MAEINGTNIECIGSVDNGLNCLKKYWDNSAMLRVFSAAKTSEGKLGAFKINGHDGVYILKNLSDHHYSLRWVKMETFNL